VSRDARWRPEARVLDLRVRRGPGSGAGRSRRRLCAVQAAEVDPTVAPV